MKINRDKIIELAWFIVVVALFVISLKMLRSGALKEQVQMFGILGPLVIFVLKSLTLIIAPLGGTPIYVISGALFGKLNGLILVLAADIFGSSVCFFLSRKYGPRILNTFAGSQNVNKIVSTVSILNNTKSFSKARLGFISMPELLAYASGLSKINFWTFTFINAIFYIPVDYIYVFLGSEVADISAKYFFIFPAMVFVMTIFGAALLYKDYQKAEGM